MSFHKDGKLTTERLYMAGASSAATERSLHTVTPEVVMSVIQLLAATCPELSTYLRLWTNGNPIIPLEIDQISLTLPTYSQVMYCVLERNRPALYYLTPEAMCSPLCEADTHD